MQKWRHLLGVSLTALSLAATAGVAHATDGYFVEGATARDQSLAGAGSADPTESLTIANNPAGLVDVGRQFNGDISLFMPWRGYDASANSALIAPGSYNSERNAFVLPALGYSQPFGPDSAWGVGMVGNGGMNTTYSANIPHAACGFFGFPQQGVFCGGRAGVDLNQGLIYVGYAQRFGNVDLGIAPVLAIQTFSAYGLGAFGAFGLSQSPNFVSDHSPSYSVGAGVRAGAIYHYSPALTFSVQGSTPIWTSNFANYQGLFAQGGSFDVPATIGAGLAYKFMPTFTVMLDYKHIFYSGVASISNAMAPIGIATMGSANGPGFGWKDVDIVALGLEWAYSDRLTLRAGYSYSTNPVTSANVMLNVLAPGTVTSHIGAGFSYAVTQNSAFDFSMLYAPRVGVSGEEYIPPAIGGPPGGYVPGTNINTWLSELEITLGYTYHWDTPVAVVAKY
ncbi:OmpP1/FadL family transporter [Rhodoblastus sp.]|uniref:OmpP1/FadL family transporter n=1 Tax=Rhodoblastus sp. TaxID=1962975 RepID=UPI003F9ACFEC